MSSFIPPSQNGHLLEIDLRDLGDHPLLAGIPIWAPDSAEAISLRDSINDRGLDYELLVDNSNRVVDGRNRRNALRELGGQPGCRPMHVHCRVVSQDEAATIIVSSLVNRRHLTKGGLAYLILPILPPVLMERRTRSLANLRQGNSRGVLNTPRQSINDLAAKLGFSSELMEQACKVRDLLEKHPELRSKIEPQIIAGELGLGGAIVAITNHLEADARAEKLGKREQHDRLFAKFLPKLVLHWDKADAEQREHMRSDLRTAMLTWPAELVADFSKIAREAAREHATAKV